MITNEKTFESALKELNSYDVNREKSSLKMKDPLDGTRIAANVASDSMSRVSKGTVLNGDVNSSDAVFVEGKVNGNITADSDVGINGVVNGDIDARNIHFQQAGVKGNSVAKQSTTLDKNAVVVGDVTAENISVDGKVKGTVRAIDKLMLESNALVSGEIIAGNISITDGARIAASITITSSEAIDDSNFEF